MTHTYSPPNNRCQFCHSHVVVDLHWRYVRCLFVQVDWLSLKQWNYAGSESNTWQCMVCQIFLSCTALYQTHAQWCSSDALQVYLSKHYWHCHPVSSRTTRGTAWRCIAKDIMPLTACGGWGGGRWGVGGGWKTINNGLPWKGEIEPLLTQPVSELFHSRATIKDFWDTWRWILGIGHHLEFNTNCDVIVLPIAFLIILYCCSTALHITDHKNKKTNNNKKLSGYGLKQIHSIPLPPPNLVTLESWPLDPMSVK